MRLPFFSTGVLSGLLLTAVGVSAASAMPLFARKLGQECVYCHTTIPRLNETGYKFRAAGWRTPDDIGKEEKEFNLGNYFSGRIQARYDASRTSIAPVASHTSQLSFDELTFFPVTGSWGKYFSSSVEMSFAPGEPAELENAYVRVAKGEQGRFFEARAGIFHPFEGYGASDRPVSLSRPYFQTNAADLDQTTFFKPWGFDQAGAEVGLEYKRTSLRATIFNGLVLRTEDGELTAFPAQGGALSKAAGMPSANSPDVQLFANQILTDEGGGLSVYYYRGNLDLPNGTTDSFFKNTFDRFAVYGSYPLGPKAIALAAYQVGRDDAVAGGTFASRGAFAEIDLPLHQYATAGLRYDWFDPAKDKSGDEIRGIVGFLNLPFQNGLQLVSEYQNKRTLRGTSATRTDNIFQVRLIFIQ